MTRLTNADIADIGSWNEYDRLIQQNLGVDLIGLAARAADRPKAEVRRALAGRKLAAVPVSSGEGIVGGFAASLAGIGEHLGMTAQAMDQPDSDGFKQAEAWGADIVIYADDHHFLARDVLSGEVADNNPATSRVFVAALELLNGGSLAGREVVVLGLGVIGRGAAERLLELGAVPLLYDVNPAAGLTPLVSRLAGAVVLPDRAALAGALTRTSLIFDATPVPEALAKNLWPANPVVAAPGVPLAWPPGWLQPKGRIGRLWHDPLQAGTAAMLAMLA